MYLYMNTGTHYLSGMNLVDTELLVYTCYWLFHFNFLFFSFMCGMCMYYWEHGSTPGEILRLTTNRAWCCPYIFECLKYLTHLTNIYKHTGNNFCSIAACHWNSVMIMTKQAVCNSIGYIVNLLVLKVFLCILWVISIMKVFFQATKLSP